MNKSKFKSVKFKPLNRFLYEENACFWRDVGMNHDIMFEEKFIENNGTLSEIEKAEREFEEGAYYKVRFQGRLNYEVALCRINETNGLFTFTIPDYKPQYKEAFQEIGDKIELKIEL